MSESKTKTTAAVRTATGRINILPPPLADRIAAGEVVERPASVVKEFVENSLDADATHIVIEIKEGGIKEIAVSDNGSGIERDDLELAVCRHATSKIATASDLNAIRTLGFRGEALPSIAAVSRFSIASRTGGDEGYCLTVQGGKIGGIVPVGLPKGTKTVAQDLFYNTPVRRKFLKSPDTENSHITETVTRLALSRLNVHFTFIRDGREVFNLPADMSLEERAARMLKSIGGDKLVPISGVFDSINVYGLIGAPNQNLGSPRAMYSYLNGRYIRDKIVIRAMLDAYKGMLPKGRYPIAVLFIELAPERVDVNVHPQKYEVRFAPDVQIVRAIIRTVADGLIKSHIEEERRTPKKIVPVRRENEESATKAKEEFGNRFYDARRTLVAEAIQKRLEPRSPAKSASEPVTTALMDGTPEKKIKSDDDERVFLKPRPETPRGFFASLDVIGQALITYIVCEDENGIVIIDQHAAHERITYTALNEAFAGREIVRQKLLIPERTPLMPEEARTLRERKGYFEKLGFSITLEGENIAVTTEVPQLLASENLPAIIRDMLFDLGDTGSEEAMGEALRETLSRIACHTSVRAGKLLSRSEIYALLRNLDETELSAFCPHGRPIYFRLSRAEIEKRFSRT